MDKRKPIRAGVIPAVFIAFVFLQALARTGPPAPQKMDRLIVYGNGFMFGVKEPEGWLGDTDKASSAHANILFYPRGHRLTNLDGVIRIRVNRKVDEHTEKDLAADMDGYRQRYPDVRFADVAVTHPSYRCLAKLFSVEGQFNEYVIYVNPGEKYGYLFSVALGTGRQPASAAELDALSAATASLVALGGQVEKAPEGQGTSFQDALKAADENVKTEKGAKYDTAFALKAGPWLSKALAACTRGLADSDLGPFTVLALVSPSGQVEKVLIQPQTKVAVCLKPQFTAHNGPKPPGPSWWVKMEVAIK